MEMNKKILILFAYMTFAVIISNSFSVNASTYKGIEETSESLVDTNDINEVYLEQQKIKENIEKYGPVNTYRFEEPVNLSSKYVRHMPILVGCPEQPTASKIGLLLTKMDRSDKINNATIAEMLRQCTSNSDFKVEPDPLPQSISICVNSLEKLLSLYNISMEGQSYSDLYRECYIRDYFDERYNQNTLEEYNSSLFSEIYEKRNKEFVDFIGYLNQYPNPIERVDEGNFSDNLNKTKPVSEDDIELATNSPIQEKPTENILNAIFSKIRNFLKWFK
jgi:hypothetical protein